MKSYKLIDTIFLMSITPGTIMEKTILGDDFYWDRIWMETVAEIEARHGSDDYNLYYNIYEYLCLLRD